jgi:hypothetical protein
MTTPDEQTRQGRVYAPVETVRKPRRGIMRVIGFFDTTAKAIVAITGVITAVIGLYALINQWTGKTPGPSPSIAANENVVADRVARCVEVHKLSGSRQLVKDAASGMPIAVRSCEWPRPAWADPDGFIEIRVESVGRDGFSEASTASKVDRIHGPCKVFLLSYDFGKMGEFEHLQPFRAKVGDMLHGAYGDPYMGKVSDLPAYPDRDEVDVFLNHSYWLADARCES